MTDESNIGAMPATPKGRRTPLGAKLWTGGIPDDPYVTVCDRGALIGAHPVDPSIYEGGRVRTVIGVGRLACLAGLLTGRLEFEVAAHLWQPSKHKRDVA